MFTRVLRETVMFLEIAGMFLLSSGKSVLEAEVQNT